MKKLRTREFRANNQDEDSTSASKKRDSSFIYGVLPVLEALRAEKRVIEKLFILDGAKEKRLIELLSLAREQNISFQKKSRESLSELVGNGANHQGVVAISASADYYDAEKLIAEITSFDRSLSLILDGIEDPRNFGAILRVGECAGVNGVFIPERRAVGLTETVSKSSAGATEYVKIAKVTNINRLIDELKANNIWVIGASGDADTNYSDWDWNQPSALVMGSEGKGLHRLTAEKCDVLVKIPMLGNIESLNVSVATGVILFEAVRQRKDRK